MNDQNRGDTSRQERDHSRSAATPTGGGLRLRRRKPGARPRSQEEGRARRLRAIPHERDHVDDRARRTARGEPLASRARTTGSSSETTISAALRSRSCSKRVERARSLREVEQLVRGVAESDDVAVLEHQAHQPMRPVERDRRHVEQAKQVSRRRGIDDDARESPFGQRVAEDREREQLVDAGRREREQVAQRSRDRAARRCRARRARRTARRCAPDTVVAHARERRRRVHLPHDEPRRRRPTLSRRSSSTPRGRLRQARRRATAPGRSTREARGRRRRRRRAIASAHATVLFPTPPFPPTIVSGRTRRSSSTPRAGRGTRAAAFRRRGGCRAGVVVDASMAAETSPIPRGGAARRGTIHRGIDASIERNAVRGSPACFGAAFTTSAATRDAERAQGST